MAKTRTSSTNKICFLFSIYFSNDSFNENWYAWGYCSLL